MCAMAAIAKPTLLRSTVIGNDHIDPAELSDLIGAIYDAALAPDRWPVVLEDIRQFVDGMSAALYAKDISGTAGGIFYTDGRVALEHQKSYFETYGKIDPSNAAHIFAEVEQGISTTDILDYDEFLQSRFYREWAQPQGIVDILNAPLEKRGSWAAMFGVFRHERHGMVDERMRERMQLILPHVRRSVLIGRVIEEGASQAANLTDALDGLSAGMFLVDADGRVMHSNAAATTLLGRRDVLVVRNGRLTAHERTAATALQEVFAAAGRGDNAVGIKGISVTLPAANDNTFLAHVLPLTSGQRVGTGASYRAVAALFVQPTAFEAPAAPEVIAKTYGLTLSELRVMVTIIQAGGVAETADALGVAETTVKTHLSRLFQKTGAARQADLVKLMAGFQSPLAR
jgi:DNA-binding CsgD family transcriptional regulator/PAS domain-containing protein